jgi:hypothetical protein
LHTNFKHIVFVFLFFLAIGRPSFGQTTQKTKDSLEVKSSSIEIAKDSTVTDTIPTKK